MGISSTFGTFTTARLGIYASQKALDVVGNNIANINTPGYTRQALDQRSLNLGGADKYSTKYDIRVGAGALVTSVNQLRDPYLDIRYRNENSNLNAAAAKLSGLNGISGYLDEVGKTNRTDGDGDGVLEAMFNELISQVQHLASPQGIGQDSSDALVRSAAKNLTSQLNKYAKDLATLAEQQEDGFKQDLANVNTILESIRNLNSSIRKTQIYGGDALELKDERNMLIDELSGYIRIDVEYQQEDLGNNKTVEKLVIKLAGDDTSKEGQEKNHTTLVDGTYAASLSIKKDSTNYDIVVSELKDKYYRTMDGSKPVDLTDTTLYGSLQSERELLTEAGEYATQEQIDNDPKAAVKRGIPYYQKALDTLANKLAQVLNDANTDAGGGVLFESSDEADDVIRASNIAISEVWANGPAIVQGEKKDNGLSTDNTNTLHILNLLTGEQSFETKPDGVDVLKTEAAYEGVIFKGSFQEFFTDYMGTTLADDVMTTEAMYQNYTTTTDGLYTERDSVSGVDLNDEAMNLMQFQKSYTAACRLMTTIDELLDKLINGTGRAGL